MLALLLAVAMAAEPPPPVAEAPIRGLWLGTQAALVEDRVRKQFPTAVGLHGSLQAHPLVGLDLSAELMPGVRYDARLGPQILLPVDPSLLSVEQLSPMRWHAGVATRLTPLRGEVGTQAGALPLALYGLVGMGVVGTRDDLVALQREGDPAAQATRRQVHPTFVGGGGISVAVGFVRTELEARHLRYSEVIVQEEAQMRPWLCGLRLAGRLGGA